MARIEESVAIECPVDKVFTYTTEAKNWPRWQSFMVDAEQTSEGEVCISTEFKGTTRMMGLSMKWTAKVTEYDPHNKWAKNIDSGNIAIDESIICAPVDEGTKFIIAYDIKARGLQKLFSPMVVNTMRKETKKSLLNLKSLLEK